MCIDECWADGVSGSVLNELPCSVRGNVAETTARLVFSRRKVNCTSMTIPSLSSTFFSRYAPFVAFAKA
jgi:hypothetical protein